VPVSNGFGRRLRYLVWDNHNNKLIGIIAIGDPVFNLSVRDTLIDWDAKARGERLVNLMDAYVLRCKLIKEFVAPVPRARIENEKRGSGAEPERVRVQSPIEPLLRSAHWSPGSAPNWFGWMWQISIPRTVC
jgi:hypothetical protein